MPYFASLLRLSIELDLGPVDERYRRADHVDMYDDDSIFFNFDNAYDLMDRASQAYDFGELAAFEGLFMHAIDCGKDPADVLELTERQRSILAGCGTYANITHLFRTSDMDGRLDLA